MREVPMEIETQRFGPWFEPEPCEATTAPETLEDEELNADDL